MSHYAANLVPIGATYNVSTLTTLLASLDIRRYRGVLISLQNPDATNPVTLVVDPSSSGVKFNTGRRQTAVAAPGEEAHVEIQPENLYPYVRISAQTDNPFPVVNNVTFEVRVECDSDAVLDKVLRTVSGSAPA